MITRDRLNQQALACEEAQSLIRLAVKDYALSRKPKAELDKVVKRIIKDCLAVLKTDALKNAAYRSLVQFYATQYSIALQLYIGDRLILYTALSTLLFHKSSGKDVDRAYTQNMRITEAREVVSQSPYIGEDDKREILNYGRALQMYHEDYTKRYILPTLQRMAEEEALDPDAEEYLGKRSTLRNKAEREVRYQRHIDEIDGLKAKGVKLVICSSHANCSPRCAPWQGRVYSLDGTRGKTDDGREYVPLEEATEIRTKNGKWFNGLLGFNCRHYLVEYKPGYRFPTVSAETEARSYAIDKQQRYMERQVRKWRAEAEMCKGTGSERYKAAKAKADEWNRRYIAFSKRHERAYFPSRTRLI
jgi:hypothetical protein